MSEQLTLKVSYICRFSKLIISYDRLPETVHTLFFSIFGLISLDKLNIQPPYKTGEYMKKLMKMYS